MRIEITVEGVEPVIHRLTKEKTLVGSGADCEIQVSAEGISRKHAAIIAKDDQYFVVDQGSTNGTFVNEARLVPGQRADFNSFFPVKLGHAVTMALLADEEGAPKFELSKAVAEVATPVVKKTEAPVTSATKKSSGTGSFKHTPAPKVTKSGTTSSRAKKASPVASSDSKEDQERMRNTKIIALVVLVGGLVYFYFEKKAPPEVVPEVVETVPEKPKMKLSDLRLKDQFPKEIHDIFNYTGLQKCTASELEKELCDKMGLPVASAPGSGIRRENDVIQFFLPFLTGAELFDQLAAKFEWGVLHKENVSQIKTRIEIIDTLLGRIEPDVWKKYAEGVKWVTVILIDRNNRPIGNPFFASADSLTKIYQDPEYVMRKETYGYGSVRLNLIGGLFRIGAL